MRIIKIMIFETGLRDATRFKKREEKEAEAKL